MPSSLAFAAALHVTHVLECGFDVSRRRCGGAFQVLRYRLLGQKVVESLPQDGFGAFGIGCGSFVASQFHERDLGRQGYRCGRAHFPEVDQFFRFGVAFRGFQNLPTNYVDPFFLMSPSRDGSASMASVS